MTSPTNAAAPTTVANPTSILVNVHCQGATKNKKTSTAGFSNGFPSQYATAAGTVTPLRRKVTATGAAQHVHIIDGMLATPPISALDTTPRRLKTCGSHARGISACTDALISNATTSAGHIDDTYA